MPEGRGLVLLEHEMPDPCAAIAANWSGDQPPRISRDDGDHDGRDHQPRAEEMQASTAAIGVFAEIKRIELAEARVHGAASSHQKKSPASLRGFLSCLGDAVSGGLHLIGLEALRALHDVE